LTNHEGRVDLVCFGCPHASIEEIRRISELLEGGKVAPGTRLWVFTSVATRGLAERCGYLDRIQGSGGRIYSDCCMIVAPLHEMGFTSMAVNSAKAALYAPTVSELDVVFGTMEDCVEIALIGKVP
jgi:predicted aconitase